MRRLLAVGASSALFWAFGPLRHAIESSMAPHMLVQFPLLALSGACAAALMPAVVHRAWARADAGGLTAVVVASCVWAYWMVPAALDEALIHPGINLLKYASWWISGALLRSAWARMSPGLTLFFLGNAAWMLATAGLIYQETTTRLCVNYRFDEQLWTGRGLIVAACALGVVALARWSTGGAAPAGDEDPISP